MIESKNSKILLNKTNLKKQYIDNNLTGEKCALFFRVSRRTINRRLNEFNIKKIPIEGNYPELRNKKWLYQKYIIEKKSTPTIAKIIGCNHHIVSDWLKKHNILLRKSGESRKGIPFTKEQKLRLSNAKKGKYKGEENPNWKGGLVSDYTRERRGYKAKQWSKLVKERDGYRCQKNNCKKTTNLHAHHIKPSIDYPELRYDINNGITLCVKHHEEEHTFNFPDWVKKK